MNNNGALQHKRHYGDTERPPHTIIGWMTIIKRGGNLSGNNTRQLYGEGTWSWDAQIQSREKTTIRLRRSEWIYSKLNFHWSADLLQRSSCPIHLSVLFRRLWLCRALEYCNNQLQLDSCCSHWQEFSSLSRLTRPHEKRLQLLLEPAWVMASSAQTAAVIYFNLAEKHWCVWNIKESIRPTSVKCFFIFILSVIW